MSNRRSWIKLRAFRTENVSGSAMLSATTTNAAVVPHAPRRRTFVNTRIRKQEPYESFVVSGMRVFWRIPRKRVGRSSARAYARLVASAHVRFDERRRQTLRTEILRIPDYHEYAPTTTVLAFAVSKLYPEKVPRRSAEIPHSVSAVCMLFFACVCVAENAVARRLAACTSFFFSIKTLFCNKMDTIFSRAYILFHIFSRMIFSA